MSEHDGHASNGEHDDHSLVGGKIAVLLISGVVTLGASLTPWIATSFLASRKALDFIRVAAAFSAGLIVSTLLIHMLPEATEFFVEYFELAYPEAVAELASEGGHGHGEDNIQRVIAYPWAHLICGGVLLLLLAIDQLFSFHLLHGQQSPECAPPAAGTGDVAAMTAKGHGHSHGQHSSASTTAAPIDTHPHSHSCDHVTASLEALAAHVQAGVSPSSGSASASNGEIAPSVPTGAHDIAIEMIAQAATTSPAGAEPAVSTSVSLQKGALKERNSTSSASSDVVISTVHSFPQTEETDMLPPSCLQGVAGALGCGNRNSREKEAAVAKLIASNAGGASAAQLVARAWIFGLAMSVHGLLDGLGIGIDSDVNGFTALAVAVVVHKIFDGISLGSAVFLANVSVFQRWLILVVTAAVSPIGIAIGMGIVESLGDNSSSLLLGQGIVFSMSAGSFLFIALMELLPSALSDGRLPHLKVAAFGLGYLSMAILGAYA